MSREHHSENSSVPLALDCKEGNYTNLHIKTEEGETITFPECVQLFVVKQEPEDWDQNQGEIAKKEIKLEEGGQSCQASEPADSNVNSSQCEQEFRSSTPNISFCEEPNKDGDSMDTVETYICTESVSSDLGTTKEWSEKTLSSGVSFQGCKIKEEQGDINPSEIYSEIVSQDLSTCGDLIANLRESEPQLQSGKPNIVCYSKSNKDGDNMDTVETYKSTETVSGDLGATKEWSEERPSSGVSFQKCKIKEEPGDMNQSEISSQTLSQDSYNYGEQGGNTMRGNQSGENFSVQSELSLQNVETQTERETQMDEWLEEEMKDDVKNMSNLRETGGEKVFCDFCQKPYNSQYYVLHMLLHKSDKSLVCVFCGKEFIMNEHTCIHAREKCYLCGKQFVYKDDLKRHVLTHPEGKPHKCDICKKRFREKVRFSIHVMKHTGERPHKCNVCEKRYTDRNRLRKHMMTHTVEKPHVCDICKKQFKEKSQCDIHMRKHTGERPYMCNVCEKRFKYASTLRKHMMIHTGEKPYECDICKKRFREKSQFGIHVMKHTGERPYKCNLCEKRFLQNCDLRRHILTHTGEKPYECEICKKRFPEKSQLRRHVLTHTGEQPHECDLCEKRFKDKAGLRLHMLIHTGEKPHECKICQKRFRRSGTLHLHMLTHTGERPHKCNLCEKRFRHRAGLRSHMFIHTGEKPHKCNLCEKRFRDKGGLRTHMLTHTGEKPHKYNVTNVSSVRKGLLEVVPTDSIANNSESIARQRLFVIQNVAMMVSRNSQMYLFV